MTTFVMSPPEAEKMTSFVRACLDKLGLDEQEWQLYADVIQEAYTAGFIRGKLR